MALQRYTARLRDGSYAQVMELKPEDRLGEWSIIGFRPTEDSLFELGDPELWRRNGLWAYSNGKHDFDIVETEPMVEVYFV